MVDLVIAALLGLGLGILIGIPLGVINIAVVDATVAGYRRFATGIGIGGACADAVHATLAFLGTGQLVTRRPDLVRVLAIVALVLIAAYALLAWRRKKVAMPDTDATSPRAILSGLLLTLPNPGSLSAWVAIAAAVLPAASPAQAFTLGACVAIGSAVWFTTLAWLVSRIPREHLALRIIPKVAMLAFVAIVVVGIVKLV